ncbi:hypothetical protein ACCO45_008811 [Purpureocillium lilacinum]|uniref:Uncharacterized protein n=1 Tax=Purpureocillium lilacinum TaxID=33203 RepID=A0ACC4DHU0_PURLI
MDGSPGGSTVVAATYYKLPRTVAAVAAAGAGAGAGAAARRLREVGRACNLAALALSLPGPGCGSDKVLAVTVQNGAPYFTLRCPVGVLPGSIKAAKWTLASPSLLWPLVGVIVVAFAARSGHARRLLSTAPS